MDDKFIITPKEDKAVTMTIVNAKIKCTKNANEKCATIKSQ
jgi:hypothetical protein